jgi:hypothetical protein
MKLTATTLSLCWAPFHVHAVQAEDNWLTLVGEPKDPAADYIQLNPSGLSRDKNMRSVPVRVSRAHARTSKDGIVFRSVEGGGRDRLRKWYRAHLAGFVLRAGKFQGNAHSRPGFQA